MYTHYKLSVQTAWLAKALYACNWYAMLLTKDYVFNPGSQGQALQTCL